MQIKPIIFMLATLWHPFLHAADAVPAHLAGTWGTAESRSETVSAESAKLIEDWRRQTLRKAAPG